MTRLISLLAMVLGLAVITWMAAGFMGSNALALSVTVLIAAAFGLGCWELLHFQGETRGLARAVDALAQTPASLATWLQSVPQSLRHTVQRRVEDQHVGLPSPILSPYLVGLLVMLGLLGTFIGMVDTLRGAVAALEGSTELEAIRNGLAAPIGGLGLAFATSVAGICSSAMLGLIATLSRRERVAVSRLLDLKINTALADFSLASQRQRAYDAMQNQAATLPEIATELRGLVGGLGALMAGLGDSNQQLSQNLLSQQSAFHSSVETEYRRLAQAVQDSLRDNLAESGRLAAASIEKPLQDLMAGMADAMVALQQTLQSATDRQLAENQALVKESQQQQREAWQTMLQEQQARTEGMVETLHEQVGLVDAMFSDSSEQLLSRLTRSTDVMLESIAEADRARLEALQSLSSSMAATLQESADTLAQQSQRYGHEIAEKSTHLLAQSDALVTARRESEQQLREELQQGTTALLEAVRSEIGTLAEIEERRGSAAVARIAELEAVTATQLAQLGAALEAPMIRMIDSAASAPAAAAEVIEQLRTEISNTLERDNKMLAERASIVADLSGLSDSLARAAGEQSAAIEKLLLTMESSLLQLTQKFDQQVEHGMASLGDMVDNFAADAVEMSSLGEAFALAVGQFSDSNQAFSERLQGLEDALTSSAERSDEQMAYYVAQAREIMDSSMLAQQDILAELKSMASNARLEA